MTRGTYSMDGNGCNSIAGMARVLSDPRRRIAGRVPGPRTGGDLAKTAWNCGPAPWKAKAASTRRTSCR